LLSVAFFDESVAPPDRFRFEQSVLVNEPRTTHPLLFEVSNANLTRWQVDLTLGELEAFLDAAPAATQARDLLARFPIDDSTVMSKRASPAGPKY
jgi:hypothetical protein